MEHIDDYGLSCLMNEATDASLWLVGRYHVPCQTGRVRSSLVASHVTADHDTDLGEYTISGSSEHQVFHSATRIVFVMISIHFSRCVLIGHCSQVKLAARRRHGRDQCCPPTLQWSILEEACSAAEEQAMDVVGGFFPPWDVRRLTSPGQ